MSTSITTFKSLVAPDVLPCPDPIVEREVMNAIQDFCKRSYILTREMTVSVSSDDIDSDLQDAIDLDLDQYISPLKIFAVKRCLIDGTEYFVKKRNIQNTNPDWSNVNEENVKFYWLITDYLVRMFDMSASDSSVYLQVACIPTRTATTVDDVLYDDWVEAITAGARARILRMPDKEWSNLSIAGVCQTEYRRLLSRAKREFLYTTPGNVQQVNWQEYGF